jgi:hypothetical protein
LLHFLAALAAAQSTSEAKLPPSFVQRSWHRRSL